MKIERINIKNYRVFKDVSFEHIDRMNVLIGANGTGKTTFFDIIGFLKDSLDSNITTALAKRGGFKEVISRDSDLNENIVIEIKFREKNSKLVTYHLEIGLLNNKPVVKREILKLRRGKGVGQPWHFIDFKVGKGVAIPDSGDYSNLVELKREEQVLKSPDILAIKGLGQFEKFKIITEFNKMIEDWQVSDFHIDNARKFSYVGYAEHLSVSGDNLSLVAKYIFENHKDIFDIILKKMSERVPDVKNIEAKVMEDGRLVLKFQDGSFQDPFISRYVSDGTIKMFAYLILLHDPKPFNLMCIEEPENQLYPSLMEELSEEFYEYAARGGQIFVTTHSPDFLNGVDIRMIYILSKENGFTTVKKASEDKELVALIEAGDKPGYLWKQKLLGSF